MQPEILMKNLTDMRKRLSELEVMLNNTLNPTFRSELNTFSTELQNFLAVTELKSAAKDYDNVSTQTQERSTFSEFMINFRKLRDSPTEIQMGLQKNDELLEESLGLMASMISKLNFKT